MPGGSQKGDSVILRNFFNDSLAQASYMVGCAATGEAIVIDPMRDIEPYLAMAKSQGLQITAVTETHIHADYLSGSRELAAATGATMYLSDEGDEDWKYQFANEPNVVLVKDQDVIRVGNVSLRVIHTPGHTPEHIALLLTDHPAGETPHSLFTGDFVFVGDVGRPDLLEKAAKIEGTMEKGARVLYQSLQKLADLPDSLLLWPGHGAGSACGKSLGGSPVTTLGYERRTNWAFQIQDEEKFVDEVLSGQPEPPKYFKEMKMQNKQGPAVLGELAPVPRLESAQGRVVDVRPVDQIRAGYVPGTLVIPFGKGLTNWAGWLLDYSQPVTLIAGSQAEADTVANQMRQIGLDVVAGWMPAAPSTEVVQAVCIDEIESSDLVIDVRGINEWNAARMEGTRHIPLGYLADHVNDLPRDRRLVVHCASGGRTPTAFSLLKEAGFSNVAELAGGLGAVQLACPHLISK